MTLISKLMKLLLASLLFLLVGTYVSAENHAVDIPANAHALGDGWESMAENMIAGYGAMPMIGTPEQIIDKLLEFSNNGLDGLTLSWVDYKDGLSQFGEKILPLMKQAGLRE